MCLCFGCVALCMCVCPCPGLPQECLPVLQRCLRSGHIDILPDQLTVNQYESGQGK